MTKDLLQSKNAFLGLVVLGSGVLIGIVAPLATDIHPAVSGLLALMLGAWAPVVAMRGAGATMDELLAVKTGIKSVQRGERPSRPFQVSPQVGELFEALESFAAESEGQGREREGLAKERDAAAAERDAVTKERDTVAQERDSLAKDCDALKQERDSLAKEHDTLKQERDGLARERDEVERERDAVVAARDEGAQKVERSASRLRDLEAELSQFRAESSAHQRSLVDAEQDLSTQVDTLTATLGEQAASIEQAARASSIGSIVCA